MEIRFATKEDIMDIANLWVNLDYYNRQVLKLEPVFRDGLVGGKARYINLLEQYFSDENTFIVFAKLDQKPVGFVIGYVINQFGNGVKDGVVDVTFVDKFSRGQGVGGKMYEFVEDYLRKKGVVGITTEVFDNNQMSLDFHEKLGYKYIAKAIELYKKLN